MRYPTTCPHCLATNPDVQALSQHVRFLCPVLRPANQLPSNVIVLATRRPPAIYDWASDPEMALDDTPPHGIERTDADGWLLSEIG